VAASYIIIWSLLVYMCGTGRNQTLIIIKMHGMYVEKNRNLVLTPSTLSVIKAA